jgi:acetyl-CoA carboxylase carboxyltransferase component
MTAKERLDSLFDSGSFFELDPLVVHQSRDFGMDERRFPGDGVIVGYGKIDARLVYAFAHDSTVLGGSVGEVFAEKVCKVYDMALKAGAPIVGLIDSVGSRIQEGLSSTAGCGEIIFRNVMASGVVPQISAVMGPCAGMMANSAALADFLLMIRGASYMFTAGPSVIQSEEGKDIPIEDLGGAVIHSGSSGTVHILANDESECLRQIRRLLTYLPCNNLEDPPQLETRDSPDRKDTSLDSIVPSHSDQTYDMRDVVSCIVDDRDFLELQALWAENMIVGLARLEGKTVGVVGNQPRILGGAIDINASSKAARFVRFCDAFNIPLVTFVDTPGLLPRVDQEHGGIARHAAKLFYAYSEATVPKIAVITRRAYGGAYAAMCSRHLRCDISFAWPTAEISVVGPEGAAEAIYSKDLSRAERPAARVKELATEYRDKYANPHAAAEKGHVDDVILPQETRHKIIIALHALANKRESRPARKHGNIPL